MDSQHVPYSKPFSITACNFVQLCTLVIYMYFGMYYVLYTVIEFSLNITLHVFSIFYFFSGATRVGKKFLCSRAHCLCQCHWSCMWYAHFNFCHTKNFADFFCVTPKTNKGSWKKERKKRKKHQQLWGEKNKQKTKTKTKKKQKLTTRRANHFNIFQRCRSINPQILRSLLLKRRHCFNYSLFGSPSTCQCMSSIWRVLSISAVVEKWKDQGG